MKKLLALSMAIILAFGLLSGCGCSKNGGEAPVAPTEEGAPQGGASEEGTPADGNSADGGAQSTPTDVELPAVSENKEVVKKEDAPKVVMIKNPESNVDSLTYHLEGCKTLEGKEAQDVSWEMVQMVGFWQCPECNPPRYEDYKNAQ